MRDGRGMRGGGGERERRGDREIENGFEDEGIREMRKEEKGS